MRLKHNSLLVCASFIALSTPAIAQEAPVDESTASDADIIIVEARRRLESVQDVPLVVNAVSSESIDDLNIREGTEIQTLVPGLQLRNESNGISGSGQVRGLQFDSNASAGASVAFYFNDAPVDAGTVLQAMYDIGQVEVLRGPQGTLRGAATPSGSITFTTKKPVLDEVGVVAQGTLNNIGLYNLNGAFNLPVLKDVLGIRLAGLVEENNSNRVHSIDSDANLDNPFAKTQSIRVNALFTPTEWLKLEGMYQIIDRETSSFDQYASFSIANPAAPASPILIRPKDRLSIQETARTTDQRFEVLNWRGEVRLGGQMLIYQGSQSKSKFNALTNSDTANFLNARDTLQNTNTRSKLKSHELRLQNEERVFGLFDYVAGYFQTSQVSPTNLTTQTAVLLPSFLGGGVAAIATTPIETTGDISEKAFFGNVTVHLGDSTQVSGGLRQISSKQPARFIKIGANLLPTGPAVNDEKLIYAASIQHKFTPDLMIYANTGTSRRYGPSIVNPSVQVLSPRLTSFIALQPEDSRSYEIGMKSAWLDNRLILNLTGFYQKFKNYPYKISTGIFYQAFDQNGPIVSNSAQFGASVPVTIKGLEAEVSFKLSPNFKIGAVASYADGKIKNGLIPCNDLNGDGAPDVTTAAPNLAQVQAAYGANFIGACTVNQRSSLQSPFGAVIQAEYSRQVSGKVDMFARSLFSYNGSSLVEPTNAFDNLGAYGLLNLFAGMRDKDGSWELTLYGKNVANTIKATRFDPPATTSYQELAPPTFRTTVGKSFTSPYSLINTTAPREFGINLRFALGSR